MNEILFYGALLAAAWRQLPALLRSGRRREAAVWVLLGLLSAGLGAVWLWVEPELGLADVLMV